MHTNQNETPAQAYLLSAQKLLDCVQIKASHNDGRLNINNATLDPVNCVCCGWPPWWPPKPRILNLNHTQLKYILQEPELNTQMCTSPAIPIMTRAQAPQNHHSTLQMNAYIISPPLLWKENHNQHQTSSDHLYLWATQHCTNPKICWCGWWHCAKWWP